MTERNNGSDLERRAKRSFDASVTAVDAATRSRLTQARYRALEELPSRRRRRRLWLLAPAGAVAALALAAWLGVLQLAAPPANEVVQNAPLGDLEILLSEEDLEMLDEELEFYGWLEEQPELANGLDGVG